jgi:hypothetical protein
MCQKHMSKEMGYVQIGQFLYTPIYLAGKHGNWQLENLLCTTE